MTQGNYNNSNRVPINGIDYDNIAHISDKTGVPFHVLCLRAEKGEKLQGGRAIEDPMVWIGYGLAGRLLGTKCTSVASVMTQGKPELEYWGVEWKTRSLVKPKGKRGCGVLFKRADIVKVNEIRLGAHISLTAALKVFQAMKQGKF